MKVLLLQLKRIGDLIVTTPAIAALRQKFPDAHITLVVSNECAALVPAIAGVDRVLVVRRGLADIAVCGAIAKERFDCGVDFTRNDRSALLTLLCRARKRIVSERIKVKAPVRARIYNAFVPHRMRDMQTLDYNLALLEPLGITNASRELHLDLPEADRERAIKLRLEEEIPNEFIIVHPGSARPEKFWEAHRWAEVIDHAQTGLGLNVVLTGGRSDHEQAHIRQIMSDLKEPVIDLSGKTDLLTLAALIAQADLLVTVDSAPMHFAAASKTPQIVLFGPTNPFHWRPNDSVALILRGESLKPVVDFSPAKSSFPMNQISTQALINAMESLLAPPQPGCT